MPKPILVVQVASILALVFSPVIYWLTIKAVTDGFQTPEEREHMPGRFMMGLAWTGTVGLALVSVYVLFMMATA